MAKQPMGEQSSYTGSLDGVYGDSLCGWAFNREAPAEKVEVNLIVNGKVWHRVRADLPREDLKLAGVGDGVHAFQIPLAKLSPPVGEPLRYVSAFTVPEHRELPLSPWIARAEADDATLPVFRVDPMNVGPAISRLTGKSVDYLLVDINNLCNADCVYCPHGRGPEQMELAQFEQLLSRMGSVQLLQIGCGQEPTADRRLTQFLAAARAARAKPRRIQLITNGTLLHRHDPALLRESLDSLMLSIDTVSAELNARLRQGTDLNRILANLSWFRDACPSAEISFSVVVTSESIDGIGELVDYGKSIGVSKYYFREVTSYLSVGDRPRRADFEDWMRTLRLPPGRFDRLGDALAGMGIDQKYYLLPDRALHAHHTNHRYESRRASELAQAIVD